MSKKCLCCNTKFGNSVTNCPSCGLEDLSAKNWIPKQLQEEFIKNHKPIRDPPSKLLFEQFVRKAAQQSGLDLKKLTVEDNHYGVIETDIPTDNYQEIIVRYKPVNLRRYTDDQLLALCRHEMFHPLTIKGTTAFPIRVSTQEVMTHQAETVFCYDEMINYKEYIKKFPNDKDLHEAKKYEFSNFLEILLTMRHRINNHLSNSLESNRMALSIYQDSVYYFFEKFDKLKQWASKNNVTSLLTFFEWLHADLILISEKTTQRSKALDAIRVVAGLILSVNLDDVFTSDKLSFLPDIDQNIQECRLKFQDALTIEIIDRWESRRSSVGIGSNLNLNN